MAWSGEDAWFIGGPSRDDLVADKLMSFLEKERKHPRATIHEVIRPGVDRVESIQVFLPSSACQKSKRRLQLLTKVQNTYLSKLGRNLGEKLRNTSIHPLRDGSILKDIP